MTPQRPSSLEQLPFFPLPGERLLRHLSGGDWRPSDVRDFGEVPSFWRYFEGPDLSVIVRTHPQLNLHHPEDDDATEALPSLGFARIQQVRFARGCRDSAGEYGVPEDEVPAELRGRLRDELARLVSEHSQYLYDGPPDARSIFVMAHGAGAPMDRPWMDGIASGVAEAGIRVVRFEFPYMRKRRVTGRRRPPNAASILETTFARVARAHAHDGHRLFLGGKSMGGRMAARLIADDFAQAPLERLPERQLAGVIALGYPFHPRGKPEKLRTAPLVALTCPALIVQGTRDPMGTREEVASYGLASSLELLWLEDGDHSFKPRKRSGYTQEAHLKTAVAAILDFIDRVA